MIRGYKKVIKMEAKKILLFRIYQILEEYSDAEHPLTHADIISILDREYDVCCERKAVGRNISFLKEAGIDIESDNRGSYLAERKLENAELRLLIDSVLCSRHINNRHSADLIDKLVSLGGKHFKSNLKNIYTVKDWQKSENCDFFYNVDIVSEAIKEGKQISFDYNKYGIDKKLHKTVRHTVSPYQMILHNQHYYLMAQNMKWSSMVYYHMDKITNISIEELPLAPIRTLKGYERGINYTQIATALPYMFADTPEEIVLECEPFMVDQIIDWFGYNVEFKKKDDAVIATLTASPSAMEFWCLQYAKHAKVISPISLKEKVTSALVNALKKYQE